MNHPAALVCALAASLAAPMLIAAAPAAQPAEFMLPFPLPLTPPCMSLYGPDSAIQHRRVERIRDEAAWNALWSEHLGEGGPRAAQGWPLPPAIDFARFEVVAFFRGDSSNRNGEIAQDVDTSGDRVRIRFDSLSYQTAVINDGRSPGPQRAGANCRPYGIWVIPRTSKPIVLEENVQGMKGHPALWRVQHEFPDLPEEGC